MRRKNLGQIARWPLSGTLPRARLPQAGALLAATAGLLLAALACVSPTADSGAGATIATSVAATLAAAPGAPTEGASLEPTLPVQAPADGGEPGPSGDELSLAYTNNGDVWLIEGAGPGRQLSTTGGAIQVVLSSDGQRIVFTRRESLDLPTEIWAVNRDGTGQTQLVASTLWNEMYSHEDFLFNDLAGIDFIPGTHLLLLGTQAVPEGPGVFRYDDLLRLDADGGVITSLLAPGQGGAFTSSPDGRTAAIVRPTSISLVNTDGTNLRSDLVTFPMIITYSEYQSYPKLTWSPDSQAVGAAIPSADPLAADTSGTVWRIDRDTAAATAGPAISGNFFFPQFGAPALAPDLMQVSFGRQGSTPNTTELYLANADGSDLELYATGDIGWKGWSPDSQHFVFSQDSPSNLALGGPSIPPAALASGNTLEWINASEFVLLSGAGGGWSLARGSIDGSLIPLVSITGDSVSFDFATD